MAAVPKNQAMTMLLGGNIGFDAAGAGVDENGEIWLSSGWSPFHDGGGEGFQTFNTNSDAAMNITGGHFTSDVYGLANSDLNAETDDGDLTFDGGVSLESYNKSVTLSAFGQNILSIGGDASLYAYEGAGGQKANILASGGGNVDITGSVFLDVAQSVPVLTSTGVFGGTVNIDANGGQISTGNLTIFAMGTGTEGDSN